MCKLWVALVPESTSLRSHTPPKYAALLAERNAGLLLEERLAHFAQWLSERGIRLQNHEMQRLSDDETQELIREYVDG
jgi:hypothetical protein